MPRPDPTRPGETADTLAGNLLKNSIAFEDDEDMEQLLLKVIERFSFEDAAKIIAAGIAARPAVTAEYGE